MNRSLLRSTGVALAAWALCAAASAGTVNLFGSSGQFAIDTDFAATGVTAVKNQQPTADPANAAGNNPSIGTFGHGRDGFNLPGVTTLGNRYNGNTGNGEALYIGDRDSRTAAQNNLDGVQRNTFDHSIVKLLFANPIVNKPGADFAVMVASGLLSSGNGTGYWREALALGVDPSIATGNYTNTLWYEAPSDFRKNAANDNGYYTILFDFTDLGLAPGASVTEVFLSNFDVVSTVSSADGFSGWVDLAGTSGTLAQGGSAYTVNAQQPAGRNSFNLNNRAGNTHWDTDPDLLYAGGLQSSHNAIPLPGTLALAGLGVAAGLFSRRQRVAR